MIIKIPTLQRKFNEETQKVESKREEMTVSIDTSFLAHLKWEEQFQSTLGISLAEYVERVKVWIKDQEMAKANFLGMLKLLYCYVNSDNLPTFKEFIKLFEPEIAEEIIKKIATVLDEITKTAAKN